MTTPITKEQLTGERIADILQMATDAAKRYGSKWDSALVGGVNGNFHAITSDTIQAVVVQTNDDSRDASWLCDYLESVSPATMISVLHELQERRKTAMDAEPVAYADPQALINFKNDEGKITARTREWMWRRPGEDLIALYATPPSPAVNAEPVADVVGWHKEGEERTCDIRWRRFDVEPGPLFAVAQPVAVVPDEMESTVEAIKRVLPTSNPDEYAACIGADMWNACRAAMLTHSEHERDMVQRVSQPYKLREQVRREHAEWSDATFGDVGPIGPLKHLSKEALETAAEPDDLSEWADMQFLLWDAQRRAGISDWEITAAMEEKLKVNMARKWPEPKDGEPRMHIKDAGNSPVIPDGWQLVPKRLSAENGAKGALSGEFSETKFINCPECFGDEECETCDGSGRLEITVPVTWTTIKTIWAKGVEHFSAAPQQEAK